MSLELVPRSWGVTNPQITQMSADEDDLNLRS
jgi:hypothetical protein